jgi:hypothetical protein
MKEHMSCIERFEAVLNFKSFDRLPIIEWAGWWDKTIDRWVAEGLPAGMSEVEIQRFLGLDAMLQDWIYARHDKLLRAAHDGQIIHSEKDYEQLKIDGMLFPANPVNVDKWQEWKRIRIKEDTVLWFSLDGFFWFPRALFGIENHLYAFYDYPELMHRMNKDLVDFNLKVINAVCTICKPDFMTIGEDMSYNNGPMISESLFEEFMLPYYRQIVPRLKAYGVKVIIDSDGDISECASWFEKAGVDGILPLERQAGVDIALLRHEHPRQIYVGAYDKMVMNRGEDAMRSEFERLLPTAKKGGFMISCDHQTPPGVSLQQYRDYVRLFREYALAAAGS